MSFPSEPQNPSLKGIMPCSLHPDASRLSLSPRKSSAPAAISLLSTLSPTRPSQECPQD